MKTKKGFTLIEVLIALTIIAGLFSFGYANFRNFSRRQATVNTAKELESAINLTKEFALSGNKPAGCSDTEPLDGYKISFNQVAETYSIFAVCAGIDESVGRTSIPLSVGTNLSLGQATNFIIFKTLGQGTSIPDDDNFFLTVSRSDVGNSAVLTVSPAGEVTTVVSSIGSSTTPTPSPTASPASGVGCQGACNVNSDCQAGLVCPGSINKCVNNACRFDPDCVCN